MTAQHAQRQGSARRRKHRGLARARAGAAAYRHHDLGFVVDLGGSDAAANPLGVPLAGLPAKVVTRGYHLLSMPGNRVRTAVDWALDAVLAARACSWASCAPPRCRWTPPRPS